MFVCNIMALVSPKSHSCSGIFIALPHAKPDCILNFADLGDNGCLLCVENLIYDPHQPLLRLYNVFSYWMVPCLAGMHLTELVAWLQVAPWKGLLIWSLCNDIGQTKPRRFRQLPGTAFTKQVYVLTKIEKSGPHHKWPVMRQTFPCHGVIVVVSIRVILENENYSYDAWGILCSNACQISCTHCWCPSPHIKCQFHYSCWLLSRRFLWHTETRPVIQQLHQQKYEHQYHDQESHRCLSCWLLLGFFGADYFVWWRVAFAKIPHWFTTLVYSVTSETRLFERQICVIEPL